MPNRRISIALAGNPNSGKTTVFNNLTGSRQHVGNYTGAVSYTHLAAQQTACLKITLL